MLSQGLLPREKTGHKMILARLSHMVSSFALTSKLMGLTIVPRSPECQHRNWIESTVVCLMSVADCGELPGGRVEVYFC